MKTKVMIISTILLATLACGLPGAVSPEPTVNALPPTPDLPFAASPIPENTSESQNVPSNLIFNVSVPASACWMNSNVTVSTGQVVTITASGRINTWNGNSISFNDPNGQAENICVEASCPIQGIGYGTLIARLEDLQPIRVGTAADFTAQKDGQLFFTVNDWECSDNSGTFDLVVSIK